MSTPDTTINSGDKTTIGNNSRSNTNNRNSNQTNNNTRRPRNGYRGTRPNQRKNREKPKTFKRVVPEVGAVIGTKHEHGKESFKKVQDAILQHVMGNNMKR